MVNANVSGRLSIPACNCGPPPCKCPLPIYSGSVVDIALPTAESPFYCVSAFGNDGWRRFFLIDSGDGQSTFDLIHLRGDKPKSDKPRCSDAQQPTLAAFVPLVRGDYEVTARDLSSELTFSLRCRNQPAEAFYGIVLTDGSSTLWTLQCGQSRRHLVDPANPPTGGPFGFDPAVRIGWSYDDLFQDVVNRLELKDGVTGATLRIQG
jgi:hypothetical protein